MYRLKAGASELDVWGRQDIVSPWLEFRDGKLTLREEVCHWMDQYNWLEGGDYQIFTLTWPKMELGTQIPVRTYELGFWDKQHAMLFKLTWGVAGV